MLDGSLFVPQSRERSTQHTMTNIEKNIRLTELACEANNIRREIQSLQTSLRNLSDRDCTGIIIEAMHQSIDNAEDRYIAVVNQINALRA